METKRSAQPTTMIHAELAPNIATTIRISEDIPDHDNSVGSPTHSQLVQAMECPDSQNNPTRGEPRISLVAGG